MVPARVAHVLNLNESVVHQTPNRSSPSFNGITNKPIIIWFNTLCYFNQVVEFIINCSGFDKQMRRGDRGVTMVGTRAR